MNRQFKLPDLGEGIHEGEIIAVLTVEGDKIAEGDPILEIETDKASVEIPSPYTGKIVQIHVKPGDIVKVGDVLMTFSISGMRDIESDVIPQPSRQMPEPSEESTSATVSSKKPPVPASPATRRLARELKVDLYMVPPSGPEGLVTADDVKLYAAGEKRFDDEKEAPAQQPPVLSTNDVFLPPLPDFSKWGPIERMPLRSIRRTTAKQMTLASSSASS